MNESMNPSPGEESAERARAAKVEELLLEISKNGRAWIERGNSATLKETRAGARDWSSLGWQIERLAALDPDECEAFGVMLVDRLGDAAKTGNKAFLIGSMALALADLARSKADGLPWPDSEDWWAYARSGVEGDDEGGAHHYSYMELQGEEPGFGDAGYHHWIAFEALAHKIDGAENESSFSAREVMEENACGWGYRHRPTEAHSQIVAVVEAYVEARALSALAGPAPRRPAARV